ncbi:Uncharacterised protein [Mycobacteroides abscessus subsp. abscessus]|nr:Uncharacterised protein [Mycobacteroides abscessus subsp. abscessus]
MGKDSKRVQRLLNSFSVISLFHLRAAALFCFRFVQSFANIVMISIVIHFTLCFTVFIFA